MRRGIRTFGRLRARGGQKSRGNLRSKAQLVNWIKKAHPKLYRGALLRIPRSENQLKGMGETAPAAVKESWFDKIISSVTNLAPTVLQFKQQKKIMDMQMQRARSGLPPANVSDFTPAVKIEASLSPQAQADIKTGVMSTVKPLLLPAGAILLFFMLRKKRR